MKRAAWWVGAVGLLCRCRCATEVPVAQRHDGVVVRDVTADAPTARPEAQWTVLVYGHADHGLSPDLVIDMREMQRAAFGAHVNVVVMADWNAAMQNAAEPEGPNFPQGTQWFHVRSGEDPELIESEPEQDLDDVDVLAHAITRAFTRYPATRYGLVLWDHGGSWKEGFGGDSQDDTEEDPAGMSIPELAEAIQTGARDAGLRGSRPLEFISFDACLMASAEVSYAMRDLTRVVIADAELDYGDGIDYEAFFSTLDAQRNAPMRAIAADEVRAWNLHHLAAGFNDRMLRSHVAIDTAGLAALARATKSLHDAVRAAPPAMASELARRAYFTRPWYSLSVDGAEPEVDFRDLGQFARSLATVEASVPGGAPVAAAARRVQTALEETIVGRAQGLLREGVGQSGVNVALPLGVDITRDMLTDYAVRGGPWAHDTGWTEMLEGLIPPEGATDPDVTTVVLADRGVRATPSGEVVEATADVVELRGTNARIRETIGRRWVRGAAPIEFHWDGALFSLRSPDGTLQDVTALQMLEGAIDATTGRAFPAMMAVPGRCALWGPREVDDCDLLILDQSPWTVMAVSVHSEEGDDVKGIERVRAAFPRARFTPLLAVEDERGEALRPVVGRSLPMPVRLERAPASRPSGYAIQTTVYDAFGRSTITEDPL